MSQPEEQEHEEHVDENYDPEKEVLGNWKPTLELPEMKTVTGEEEEDELAKFRVKLYRWRDSEWKERGVGDLKFLSHKESKKIRIIVRADKIGKAVANHYGKTSYSVQPCKALCILQKQKTNDKAVIWDCYDFSDEEGASYEKFCAKFTSADELTRFQKEFEAAYEKNKPLFVSSSETGDKEKVEEKPSN